MQVNSNKKWYQKLWYIVPLGFFALLIAVGITSGPENSNQTTQQQTKDTITIPARVEPFRVQQVQPEVTRPVETQQEAPKYYINSQGNRIQSPTRSQDGSVPAGASARCRDGTYSFSQSRRGTCSHHGGVGEWLY